MLPEPGAGPPQGGRSPLGGPGAGDRGRGVVMSDRRNALTPEALAMMDTIARTGSFAAAARELGRVPSAAGRDGRRGQPRKARGHRLGNAAEHRLRWRDLARDDVRAGRSLLRA